MKIPVIDACFAIKWFVPEEGSEKARKFLSKLDHFVVPDLFLIEFDNILSKKVRKRELEISGAEEIYSLVRNFHFVSVPYEKFSEEILFISTRFAVTQYDACYIALATEYNGLFYTADQRLLRGVEHTAYAEFVIGLDEL